MYQLTDFVPVLCPLSKTVVILVSLSELLITLAAWQLPQDCVWWCRVSWEKFPSSCALSRS